MIVRETRPSAPLFVCAPVAVAPAAQAYALGRPDVAVRFPTRLVPITALNGSAFNGSAPNERTFTERTTIKIYNCMGSTSAKGEGMALSIIEDQSVSAQRAHAVQVVKVKGGDARGIPPRGRPV